jgi:predicted dinucleotide-binding enzyme
MRHSRDARLTAAEGGDMRIGVIGSGQVGQVLAAGLKKHGYEVKIGSRTPAKLSEFSKSAEINAGTFADVAAWAEGVVLAVKGAAAEEAVREAGAANVNGKLVLDTTNPISNERAPVISPGSAPGGKLSVHGSPF